MVAFYSVKNHKEKFCILFLFLIIFFHKSLRSQCISTYPNTEGFESSPAWTSGGTNSDWTWGTPSKPTISSAGGGTKCWITGGLTISHYNNGEQSYIVSPCYDFTSLTYPHVSLKVFWESEFKYDGAKLQYSINNGATWINVGSSSDPINCMNNNWYNDATVKYLNSPLWISPDDAWAGNIQTGCASGCQCGNGSGGWVVAQHCLNGLAGQPNVIFRIVFGAGTSCNNFDGFAIDDFTVENGIPNAPDFTYACSGINAISFTNVNPACPIPSTYLWNFGDAASGASNTSTVVNPNHVYSSAGSYTVTLTTSGGPCNPSGTISKNVVVIANNPNVVITPSGSLTFCQGQTLTLTASGATSYSWSNGATTPNINVNASGTYTVTGTSPCGAANATKTITVNASPNVQILPVSFICPNDSLLLTATGANSYSWSTGNTTNSIYVHNAGNYSVIGTTANCSNTASTSVSVISLNASFTANPNNGAVPLNVGLINTSTNASNYSWNFGNGNSSTIQNPNTSYLTSGTYTVTLTASNGSCTETYSQIIIVTESASSLIIPNVFTPNGDGINDYFTITKVGISDFNIIIYDRWGLEIFDSNQISASWDGNNKKGHSVSDGTYFYVINAKGVDAKNYNFKGFISLIR